MTEAEEDVVRVSSGLRPSSPRIVLLAAIVFGCLAVVIAGVTAVGAASATISGENRSLMAPAFLLVGLALVLTVGSTIAGFLMGARSMLWRVTAVALQVAALAATIVPFWTLGWKHIDGMAPALMLVCAFGQVASLLVSLIARVE